MANKVVTEDESSKSLLWKVTGNDLSAPSYVFGTIHMIDAEDYFLPNGTLTALEQSSLVVFEIDMNEMTDITKLMPLMQKAMMDGDVSLKDLLSDEEYALVKSHFAELGLPLFFLEKIKPMFLTVFATGDFSPGDLQSGRIKSYEMEFAELAKDGSKEIAGLETIEYQIGIFDAIPYEDQAKMLIEAIKSSDTEDSSLQELVELYKQQDVEGLYQMMKGDESIGEYEDILLNQRNNNWIPIMEDMMTNGATFFAVGAGHLGGPNGVLQLLRQKGYKVTSS